MTLIRALTVLPCLSLLIIIIIIISIFIYSNISIHTYIHTYNTRQGLKSTSEKALNCHTNMFNDMPNHHCFLYYQRNWYIPIHKSLIIRDEFKLKIFVLKFFWLFIPPTMLCNFFYWIGSQHGLQLSSIYFIMISPYLLT